MGERTKEDREEREDVKSKNAKKDESDDAATTKGRGLEEKKQQDQQQEEPATVAEEENFECESRDLPDAFYCPLTGKIMKDPVVHPDGTSFERSAVADASDGTIYYPNRALQAIIQQEVLPRRSNVPLQRTIMDSMRKSFLGLVDRSSTSLHRDTVRPLSDQYYCSITFEIMENPVIDPDGHTFESRAIINWIRINGRSPATRNSLTEKQLYENTAIKNLLDEEVARDDESINASIRRWKEQTKEDVDDEERGPEEGNHPENGNATTIATPMEEIEERGRSHWRREQERVLKFRICLILMVVVAVGNLIFICTKALLKSQQEG